MKIITSDCNLDLTLDNTSIQAHTPSIVTDGAAITIKKALDREHLPLRVSGMGHYIRHYSGQPIADGARLLVWRGCGYGDQLMASAVIRAILWHRPELRNRIDLYCTPIGHRRLWLDASRGLPFRALPEPVPLATWKNYGAHLLLTDMCEADAEPDQQHTVDRMIWAAGIDPETVPPEQKLPFVPITEADRAEAAEILGAAPGDPLPETTVLWQLASSTPIRSYAPAQTRKAIAGLLAAEVRVLITAMPDQVEQYQPLTPGAELVKTTGIRPVFALAERVHCTVCPDSVLGHVTGGLGKPCVGLWGSFNPAWRAAYYTQHRALVGSAPCSPCAVHETSNQPDGCPLRMNRPMRERYCAALADIPPEAIVAATLEAAAQHQP